MMNLKDLAAVARVLATVTVGLMRFHSAPVKCVPQGDSE
jgi:hypothetical protein